MSSQEDKKFLFLTSDDNKEHKTPEEDISMPQKAEKLFPQQEGEIPVKRLNDVDSKIFEDSAYNAVEDISLKLELKMLQMNKELDLINEQIELLNIVNPENKEQKINEFYEQIQKRKNILSDLKKEYRNLGILYKINDTMSSTIELTEQNLKKTKETISNTELANKSIALVPFLKTRSYLVKTMDKLGKIYNKLEEMSNSKQTPWGESDERMDNFVSFMRTANKLDASISRFFGLKPQIDSSKKKTSLSNKM